MTSSSSSSSQQQSKPKQEQPLPSLDLGKLGIGLMQWGTTDIDNKIVNPKGNLSDSECQEIWETCRRRRSNNASSNIIFFDTAEGYGGGTSEIRIRKIQEWYNNNKLQQQQNENNENKNQKIIIATKFLPTIWRWTKGSFYKSLKGSLERLGLDCIDLYFIHTPIHPLPIEYFIEWSCDAIDDGLIKEIGISNCNSELVQRAHNVASARGKRIACNQIMLNLLVWKSSEHQRTVKLCHDLNITIAAYSPIGQGLLTDNLTIDKFTKIRAVKMTGVQYDEIQPLRNEIFKISQSQESSDDQTNNTNNHNRSMAQVAINWVRSHNAVPLIGCRSVEQVNDAILSLNWELTSEESARLDKLSLGLSLFERPLLRRCLFVIFISLLQLAYYTEIQYKQIKNYVMNIIIANGGGDGAGAGDDAGGSSSSSSTHSDDKKKD